MKVRSIPWIITLAALASLESPVRLAAQEQEHKKGHHHYKLIEVRPRGGPQSYLSGPFAQILNNQGTIVAYANTAVPNPNADCAIPFNANGGGGDCSVEHPVVWQNGTVTDLEVLPGGTNGQTDWISANGLIAGWSENGLLDPTGLPEGRAVLWTQDGKITDLGTVPGGTGSLAVAVNNLGQVVGFSDNDIPDAFSLAGVATQTRAFLWQDGVMTDLGTLGGPDAIAFLVNERGQISGIAYTDSIASTNCFPLTTHPFFWEHGEMVDVGTLGGTCGIANWMNNRGQVVGYSNVVGDQSNHAFRWEKGQGLKDLGTLPGGSFSAANWINDSGEIVGASDVSSGGHAVLWKNGAMIDLGILPGDCSSEALSINSEGQIVGNSSPDCVQDGVAVLFENGGAPIDLNTLVSPGSHLTVTFVFEINDRGEIAGVAYRPNGDERGVLLIPCDENHSEVEGCDYSLVDASTTPQSPAPRAIPSATQHPSQSRRTIWHRIPGLLPSGR